MYEGVDLDTCAKVAWNEIDLSKLDKYEANDMLVDKFYESMDDDFNSAKVIADLFVEFTNYAKTKSEKVAGAIVNSLPLVQQILGILKHEPKQFINNVQQKYLKILNITEKEIEEIINTRLEAKKQKNYILADSLRNNLDNRGIMLKDTKDGTIWDIKQLY